ncbi:LacI family transcriptional regulator [Achromobacter pulmonis]|uniref:LacI family transcriptional regulator n=1 Tax=Achromobacter pulmonis TaxID=1389932 RepID=A0A2N8KF46_9BURK|nr:tripartite tricarboxylate transporter substrate binding protein [Achromobacter pulmonis]PND32061.1 LacI family transcriptional regulator [Achromobacter pulmonis]
MIRKLLAVAALAAACTAHAQDYPNKPIRIIIPSTPGGGTDYIGRLMSTKLHELNGWAVIPENKPGAGTALGLAPVALVATTPMVLLVADGSPYKTLPEVIEAAKKEPNKISYGTSGTGGGVHIAMEMLQHEAGFKMQHVPYKGSAPALADLMGGHLQFAGSSISSAATLIKSGKVRALAVTSPKRNPALPDVPTVAELGYKDFSVVTYYGVLAPAKTPKAVVSRLNSDFNKLLARKDVQEALASQGLETDPVSTEQFAALIQSDIGKARETIKSAGIVVQQ